MRDEFLCLNSFSFVILVFPMVSSIEKQKL